MVLAELSDESVPPPPEVFDATPATPEPVHLAEVKVRYDLSVLQSLRRCLLTIVNEGSLNLSTLSKQVFLSASTVVGILDRLEEKGLVTRQRDYKDRRLINIQATVKGRELVAQAPSPLPTALAESLQQLPELEQATIALSLARVVGLMEERYVQDASVAKDAPPPEGL
jgi:DNA-binding MarR family transcriptional regulator